MIVYGFPTAKYCRDYKNLCKEIKDALEEGRESCKIVVSVEGCDVVRADLQSKGFIIANQTPHGDAVSMVLEVSWDPSLICIGS